MKPFVLLFLGVALLAACRKDDVIVCDPVVAPSSFADIRAAAPAVQRFTFNLAQAQSLLTSKGTRLAFGPNVFYLPNNTLATGQAELRIREVFTVGDMLLTDMPTTTGSPFGSYRFGNPFSGQVLISGGEFNIQVWQGNNRLRFATFASPANGVSGFMLASPVPAAGLDTTRMLLWNQPATAWGSIARDTAGWQRVFYPTAIGFGPQIPVATAAGNFSVVLPLDSLGNWNLDQLWHAYQGASSGPIGVEVPLSTSATATRVYVRPVGFNGLARCGYTNFGTGSRWYCLLPYGAAVIAVVLQERGGVLYYGTQRTTTAANLVITPPLEAVSAAEAVRRIRLL
ncbi:hypothetical protein [Hymenobacter rubidus]|uniref:hypothetical protein n=1 Tax=Hymenobacter rubidus TaxID=1441626 RepID=UPI00191E999C|nr:hypothetical protein [Hymenobacter rubidus]